MADKVSRVEYPQFFAANVQFVDVTLPTGSAAAVGDSQVKSGAKIAASKLRRRMHKTYSQGNVAAVTETKQLHMAYGAVGEVVAFRVSDIARATGAATVTFDLRKNGVSILTGVTTLDSTHPSGATYGVVDGSLNPASVGYVAGDVFDVVITATAGGGVLPTGIACDMTVDEDPA